MYEIIQNGEELFILFISPLFGLFLENFLPKKVILALLTFTGALLTPYLFGYNYIFPSIFQILSIICLGCLYSIYSGQMERNKSKMISAFIYTGLLFIILGFAAVMDAFSGSQTVIKNWSTSDYRIQYIEDQGFAGSPLMKYELSKYGFIPLLIKHIDSQADNDSLPTCKIKFDESKMVFDKCKGRII